MTTAHPVVVIGGGFSGVMTAIHLARQGHDRGVRVKIINPRHSLAKGLAYQFEDDNLLLNVPAGNMSAFADKPNHFLDYCQRLDPSVLPSSFMSRRIYGQYLFDLLQDTQSAYPGAIETVDGEVVGLERSAGDAVWRVTLAGGASLLVGQLVLAIGHQPVRLPFAAHPDTAAFVLDAWDFSAMQKLPEDEPVVILGTGLTAIDALFCLTQNRPKRHVHMISRHGLVPHRHRVTAPLHQHAGFPDDLFDEPATARHYLRVLRRQLKTDAANHKNWRDTLNEWRAHTPQIWQSLSLTEQQRFLRHLQTFWDIHRHRLAPIAAQRFDALQARGQVDILAGRLTAVTLNNDQLQIQVQARGQQHSQTLSACALVNCVGPSMDFRRSDHPLLLQMIQSGLLQMHANGLGPMVSAHHQLLDHAQQPIDGLWYVGPGLKAQYWEATAVPELRRHAQTLASSLVASLVASRVPSLDESLFQAI